MPVVAPNVLNTIRAARTLLLMENEDDAKVFETSLDWFEIYVPSDHGGRLRVGFGRRFHDDAHALVLEGSNGVTARTDSTTQEAHVDFEPGARGDGVCKVYVSAPLGKFSIYALFDEVGFARDTDGSPLIPWNFWYFPYSNKQKDTAWGSDVMSPLRRYMEAFDVTNALAWELEHHGDPDGTRQSWEGHCDDAAAASILFVAPPDDGLTHNGVRFKAEDLKFYAVEYFGRFGSLDRVWTLKEEHRGIREGFFHQFKPNDDPAQFGQVIAVFIDHLRRHIRDLGAPLRMDLRDGNGGDYRQLWNHAVYKYAARYWQRDPTDPRRTEGQLILSANGDFIPQDGRSSGVPAKVRLVRGERVVEPNGTGRDLRIEFGLRFRGTGEMDAASEDNEWWSVRNWNPVTNSEFGELLHAPRDVNIVLRSWDLDFERPASRGNPHIKREHVENLLLIRERFR